MKIMIIIMFCFPCIFFVLAAARNSGTVVPVKVGVVLDMDTRLGKLGLSCINMSLSDFYATHNHYKTRLNLVVRNSYNDSVGAAAAALDLIMNVQVDAIIGPENSMQTNFVIDLGKKYHVPIISFSATSPSLTSLRSPYFFRATQNDSSQVKAISAIFQAFGWRQAVPIYVDNEFGEGILPYLSDALKEVDARIPYRSVISPDAMDVDIKAELYKLMTMQTRVFILHMRWELGKRIFDIANEIGMMGKGYVWIVTDGLTNEWSLIDEESDSKLDSMQGVLGVRAYVPKSKKLEDIKLRWKRKFLQEDGILDIFGVRAYDATTALAMAVEKLLIGSSSSSNFIFSDTSSLKTDLKSVEVSPIGHKLIQALSSTKFRGLGGEFGFFANGQLNSSDFKIINVNGKVENVVGFWTSRNGLVSNEAAVRRNGSSCSTSSRDNNLLGSITWPGPEDSCSVPKGWQVPTKSYRLKVGVPVDSGFSEFVKVTPNSNDVGGYCIDVFKAVLEQLPYAVPYDFFPFRKTPSSNEMNGTYDDLVLKVYTNEYDAVVGDVAIVSSRSLIVDFTLPFTESGVVMVVPMKDSTKKDGWVFLKPLSPKLWTTIGCFFVFIGFVIWVLEHRINGDFRGTPSNQIGTSFWFSFSTMVFAHRERVHSNPARFVVVIWCFVLIILTQSYTANLASLLTVQQLRAAETDVNRLKREGKNIGHLNGSFVQGKLIGLGFNPNKLRYFSSPEELDELFSNGSIAAAFDETPYMNLFLGKYCNKYSTSGGTIFKTGGFGFVFPKGSPLVADFSRGILNVTESEKMKDINKNLNIGNCSADSSSALVASNSLEVESFMGLFLIAGVAGTFALVIFAAEFLYQQKDVLLDSSTSLRNRTRKMLKIFVDKDLSSHNFKQQQTELLPIVVVADNEHGNGPQLLIEASASASASASPSVINSPPSPSSSISTQGRPSTDDHDEDHLSSTISP